MVPVVKATRNKAKPASCSRRNQNRSRGWSFNSDVVPIPGFEKETELEANSFCFSSMREFCLLIQKFCVVEVESDMSSGRRWFEDERDCGADESDGYVELTRTHRRMLARSCIIVRKPSAKVDCIYSMSPSF